jgi:large subunit ribosomal protein L49
MLELIVISPKQIQKVPARFSSYQSSEKFQDIEDHPEVVVEHNPPEWKFVENLLAKPIVPKPLVKEEYPSGWSPPKQESTKLPFFVERSKNYMLPVYLRKTFRGQREVTVLRRIEGDIWKLEEELRNLIEKKYNKPISTRINEMSRQVNFHGDHVEFIKHHLLKMGF